MSISPSVSYYNLNCAQRTQRHLSAKLTLYLLSDWLNLLVTSRYVLTLYYSTKMVGVGPHSKKKICYYYDGKYEQIAIKLCWGVK